VEFKKCVSVFDENHRFSPKYDENDTMTVAADVVLTSVGQAMDWGSLLTDSKVELNPNKTIRADAFTYQTAEPDVFAGGDSYTGPRFAIDAIAAGKEGAISIHRYVQPGQSLVIGRDRKEYHALDKTNVVFEGYDSTARQSTGHVEGNKSKETFKDLRVTFTEDQIKKETERCLSCGATIVDQYMCVGCGQCTTKCKFDAISLIRVHDSASVEIKDLRPTVAKNVIRREGRIIVKRVKKFFVK